MNICTSWPLISALYSRVRTFIAVAKSTLKNKFNPITSMLTCLLETLSICHAIVLVVRYGPKTQVASICTTSVIFLGYLYHFPTFFQKIFEFSLSIPSVFFVYFVKGIAFHNFFFIAEQFSFQSWEFHTDFFFVAKRSYLMRRLSTSFTVQNFK